ncbi:hypothetical protein EG831_08080, partial [bacterium]|nr:hypothetical protein [bacterium]
MAAYFEQPGPGNTAETLRLARRRADELGIRQVLVATTSGATAALAAETFKGCHVVAVT